MSKFTGLVPRIDKDKSIPLSKIERDMFPWGRIVAVHTIGDYEIIEYLARKSDGCTLTTELTDTHMFHVNGQSCDFPSLDYALIGAIAMKYNGNDTHATYYACKMLGLPEHA